MGCNYKSINLIDTRDSSKNHLSINTNCVYGLQFNKNLINYSLLTYSDFPSNIIEIWDIRHSKKPIFEKPNDKPIVHASWINSKTFSYLEKDGISLNFIKIFENFNDNSNMDINCYNQSRSRILTKNNNSDNWISFEHSFNESVGIIISSSGKLHVYKTPIFESSLSFSRLSDKMVFTNSTNKISLYSTQNDSILNHMLQRTINGYNEITKNINLQLDDIIFPQSLIDFWKSLIHFSNNSDCKIGILSLLMENEKNELEKINSSHDLRNICVKMCGWDVNFTLSNSLNDFLLNLKKEGNIEKSILIGIVTDNLLLVQELIKHNSKFSPLMLVLSWDSNNSTELWRSICIALCDQFENCYIVAAIKILLYKNDALNSQKLIDEIIENHKDIEIYDRIAILCYICPLNKLIKYVEEFKNEAISKGNINYFFLTGLLSVDYCTVLENYVENVAYLNNVIILISYRLTIFKH